MRQPQWTGTDTKIFSANDCRTVRAAARPGKGYQDLLRKRLQNGEGAGPAGLGRRHRPHPRSARSAMMGACPASRRIELTGTKGHR